MSNVEFTNDKCGSKPRVFFCNDKQAADLKQFCCNRKSILNIDPTFGLGNFYLTATSYRTPMFANKDTEREVFMPGPMMLHTKKDTETYEYFGKQISIAVNNRKVSFFGTNGETALVNGLKASNSFRDTSHVLCMIHQKNNCRHKYEQYETYLEQYKHMWETLETEETGKSAIFSTWFSARKSNSVKTTMLQELRREADQGDIPGQYITNDAESLNSMISKWTGENKQTWESISKSMNDFVESKHKELKMAVYGSGDRIMTEPYIHLKVTQEKCDF